MKDNIPEDVKSKCNHNRFKGTMLAWYSWIEKKIKHRAKQKQCTNCKLWLFKEEY